MKLRTLVFVKIYFVKILPIFLCAIASGIASADEEPIRIAYIDPLSGAFASTGESGYVQMEHVIEHRINANGGVLGRKMEAIAFDNKGSPTDTQLQLKRVISKGIRFVVSGNSSAVANVLNSALEKHNKRNPDMRVLYLNYSAVDPILTEENCSFWHFRFDAHADIKMAAMTDHIASNPDIKRVYIIGQDYSFGKTVSSSARQMLKAKRPDIEIVGDELHPIGKVKDFTPYVTKIGSAKADAVITGNWGADMIALARSITDAGINVPIYTYYGAYDGITATLGEAGKDKIYLVHQGLANYNLRDEWLDYNYTFKAENPKFDITVPRMVYAIEMLAKAIEKAQSTEPYDVALALENMKYTNMNGEELWMRPDDHQIFSPMSVSVHTDENIKVDADNSGYGLMTKMTIPMAETIMPTKCQMKRPLDG